MMTIPPADIELPSPPIKPDPGGIAWNARLWRILGLQFSILVLISILIAAFDIDRRMASLFYRPDSGWFLAKRPLWEWMYRYGTIPGIVVTLSALLIWVAALYFESLKAWRRPCLLVVLTTIIAAGLLVNVVLKQYWGRPRPKEIIEFGGRWEYRHILPPGPSGKGSSFPCGHCTMGFVLLAMISFRRQSKILAISGTVTGVVLGVLLSAARIVQGAHFVSDTIWSLGIVGMVATVLHAYFLGNNTRKRQADAKAITGQRKVLITISTLIAAIIMVGGFLTRRPYYKTCIYRFEISRPVEIIDIRINADPKQVLIRYAQQKAGQLQVDTQGFGWIRQNYRLGYDTRVNGKTLLLNLNIDARSYFAELDQALTLTLPGAAKDQVKILLQGETVNKSKLLEYDAVR